MNIESAAGISAFQDSVAAQAKDLAVLGKAHEAAKAEAAALVEMIDDAAQIGDGASQSSIDLQA
jgi:hypothetical protein